MGLKSGQEWAGLIVCKDDTGALSTPSVGPVGALYVNGTLNAASVTVSGSNPYKWVVTLPTLSPGDLVSMYMTATIDGVATAEVVAEDVVDTYRISDIEELVDDIGVAGAWLTAIPWNADWDAEVESEAADALNAYDPPTNSEMEARTLPSASYFDPAADTVANVTTVASTTTVGATGLAAIAAAVWDRLTSALTTAGSVGAYLLSKLGLLTSATSVTVASPISGGTVTTVQGDDYKAEDGRAIEWKVSTPVDLAGGTVEVVLSGVATYTGSVVGTDTIRLELTAEETAAIPAKHRGRYQVIHTQSAALGSDVTTLAEGTWISNERVTV